MPGFNVQVRYEGQPGLVEYDNETQEVSVQLENAIKTREAHQFLTTRQTFRIPQSPEMDDYREETAVPTDSIMHMELALCTLFANTGIFVEWETQEIFGADE